MTTPTGRGFLSFNKNWAGEIRPSGIEIGFDYQFALPSNHNDGFKTYLENHQLLWIKDEIKDLPKKPTVDQLSKIRYDDEVDSSLTAKGIEFITENKDRPFFLYLALTATHTHITPHKRFRGTSPLGQLGDYINELDFHVGEIMETLKKHGLENNTILFFSSDNGGSPKDHESAGKNLSLRDSSEDVGPKAKNAKLTASKKLGHKTNGNLRGSKGKTYEGGVRVPFIVRWPQRIVAGSQSHQLITLTDILATAAGFLGQNLPESAGVDSFDISPVMLGKSQKTPSRTNVIVQNARGLLAFREGDWKLRFQKQPQWQGDKAKLHEKYELYNLAKDPAEQNDMAKAHPERAKAMVKNLTEILNNGRSR